MALGLGLLCGVAGVGAVVRAEAGERAGGSGKTLVTDGEVEDAVVRMRTWLYEQQQADGSWEQKVKGNWKSKHPEGGVTALVTYALLASGESYQGPALARAIGYLEKVSMKGTYAVSLRAHVWASLPDAFGPRLKADVAWLHAAQWRGLFDYVNPPRKRSAGPEGVAVNSSLSRTQYGTLALWEFAKRGGKVKPAFWKEMAAWMRRSQLPDGGWNYGPGTTRKGTPADGGMTCAGLTLLCVARQQVGNDDPADRAAIERGLAWLDMNFEGEPITDRDEKNAGMFWYGLERVGLATGVSRLGGLDWFEAGAGHILKRERAGKVKPVSSVFSSDLIETAFSLAFLARGRVPVWAAKLKLPNQTWDTQPNDLMFLTHELSDRREAELNWQVVGFESSPEAWRRAPVLYVSSDAALDLTPDQEAAIKRYLDLGGLLVASRSGRGRGFVKSVKALGKRLYPDFAFETPPADGPLSLLINDVGRGRKGYRPSFEVLGNGARMLMVLPKGDWSAAFGGGRGLRRSGRDAWDVAHNLYALVSDRGELNNRLAVGVMGDGATAGDGQKGEEGEENEQTPLWRVARGRYAAGMWDVEPLTWEAVGRALAARAGEGHVQVEGVDLSQAGTLDLGTLLHITGVQEAVLTEDEVAGVAAFVNAGGTVLLETAGGLGDFADAAAGQMGRALGVSARWLDVEDEVMSGEGLAGGLDVRKVMHRRYTAIYGDTPPAPSVGCIRMPEGGRVLVLSRDVSVGALGCGYFQINGYATKSARGLLGNMLLSAANAAKTSRTGNVSDTP